MKLALSKGFRDAREVVGTGVAATIAAAGWIVIGVAALLERPLTRAASSGQSEPSLIEAATFGVVLPLASYSFCARAGGTRDELGSAYWTRHGLDRRPYAVHRQHRTDADERVRRAVDDGVR